MWAPLLLGTLVLLPASAEVPKYLVTLPARLDFPSTQRICLDLRAGSRDVKFTVTLETKDKTQKLLELPGMKRAGLQCGSFVVPPPAGGTEEAATIRVSGVGDNLRFEEKKKVFIQRQESRAFVHMDKGVYLPGQRARFRIVTMNSNFVPVNDKYSKVELQDPSGNRIAQWLEVEPQQGIVDLSFQLAPEAMLGTYTVAVAEDKTFGTFSVEEYVLPKFKVEVLEPKQLSTAEESFIVKMCSRYTYGKPVHGAVQVTVCQKAHRYWYHHGREEQDICRSLSGQTDKSGCFSSSVSMSIFNLTGGSYEYRIHFVASVTEEGTGVEANGTQDVYISSQVGSITFEDTNNFYYPNFPFSGKVRARGHDNSLLKNHPVFLVTHGGKEATSQTLTTDGDGLASFTLDTAGWNGAGVSLEGRFQMEDVTYDPKQVPRYYQNAYLYVQPFYNTTRSFLGIHQPKGLLECGQPHEVRVDYYVDPADASPDQEVIFSYYVMGRRGLEIAGQRRLTAKETGRKGSFPLSLTVTPSLAPDPSLVIYTIFPSGGVVADKVQFSAEMCFDNQVALSFSPSQQLPGADAELQLQAAPGSLCALRAVDQSVLLLRPDQELSSRSVYGMFPSWYSHYPYPVAEDRCDEPSPWGFPQPLMDPVPGARLSRPSFIWGPWFSEDADLFGFFQDMGLKILSNAKVKKPVDCSYHALEHSVPMGAAAGGGARKEAELLSSSRPPEGSRVRQDFPETWLWSLLPVGDSGRELVHTTLPDTITEWKAMMFCTSLSRGFGLSPTVGLTAFQPFFVHLTLPYSVVRGESFRLAATVFNYLKGCIRVQTSLAESDAYQVDAGSDCAASRCLCAEEAHTCHWSVTAVKLGHVNFTVSTEILDSSEPCGGRKGLVPERGRSDTLIKPVLVKPEGVLVEKTHSSLLCPKVTGEVASESVSLKLPLEVVPDSTKAYVTVLGDIMGTALQNLDSLVQMPSGCGEQNMVFFAPIIHVLRYLDKVGLLTEETRSRATGFLEIGYQKELTYKHSDGSYSAFGERDGAGNTWLTAFVMKSFSQARAFIFVDDKTVQDAVRWLVGKQLPSGCYASVGNLLHTAMKGGVDDEVSLAAYITAALLEMGKTTEDPEVSRGLMCLRNAVPATSSLYTQALLAYTFGLAGETELRNTLLEQLDQQAVTSGESTHWTQKPARSPDTSPWSEPHAVDVELTAYVLLAQLSKARLTRRELAKATSIVTWLAKQRNAYGGFSSTQVLRSDMSRCVRAIKGPRGSHTPPMSENLFTAWEAAQDTVVALQALAQYATIAYAPLEGVSLAVRSTGNFQHTFSLHPANRLVMQRESLPDVPGTYTLEASGQGCVYTQVVLRYNVIPREDMETFSVSVEVGKASCEQPSSPRSLTLRVHASYVGSRSSSNMAIVEVRMLSGFSPAEGTRQALLQQPLVKKVEPGTDKLDIYLEELGKETQTFAFTISQSVLVTNLKPAAIKVYDYYLPDEQATIEYADPCE